LGYILPSISKIIKSPNDDYFALDETNSISLSIVLLDEIHTSNIEYKNADGIEGERILICGTYLNSETKVNNIYVAVFNTIYNITEGVY